MRAIRIHEHGGPEVMRLEDVPLPRPGEGEARVRVRFAGVNFIDVYRRTGFYPVPGLPVVPGAEASGVVEAVGPGVTEVAEGDRVAFWDAPGAYAEAVLHRAERLLALPEEVDFQAGAALPLQGMTAHYLTRTIRPLSPGDTVLIHAAAGGVGLLAVQMAKLAGARVIGTCSTEEKAERARSTGADHVIRYTEEDFVERAKELTGGAGVDLALDGVGRATFEGSVAATRVRGHVILFGQASGEPDPIRPRHLLGSRTLTTASLFDYARDRRELQERAGQVFEWHRRGELAVRIDRVLSLHEAMEAHRLLEARKTSGKLLLSP
ncbi:MAG: quinone oxidoreductase family protein [Thermoanaerobaculia bacterium]